MTNPNHPPQNPNHPPPAPGGPHEEPHGTVIIHVNSKEVPTRRGAHTVAEIKKLGGVPLADELDQKVSETIVPLDQDGKVVIKGGEVFVSFPATGTSS